MKITVIGHLARDFFHLPDASGSENVVETLGGVFYSIATLSALLSPDDKIFPVFGVHEDEYENMLQRFLKINIKIENY